MKKSVVLLLVLVALTGMLLMEGCSTKQEAQQPAAPAKIRIAIGTQSQCTDTYTGGTIIKELGLLEKYLPKDKYEIVWEDYLSGGPITNQMIGGKLDIGLMGDMPLVVNGYQGQSLPNYQSYLIALTGWNDQGVGNALLVPKTSKATSVADLKGKTVSVPFGSASHRFLLKALSDNGLKETDVNLLDQNISVGAANIEQGKIDAHATFCPSGEYLVQRGARKLYDGGQSNIPYIHGVVVRKEFADKHPEVVVAYLKALIDANSYTRSHPEEISRNLENWTKFSYEVNKFYIEKFVWDATLSDNHVKVLKDDANFLKDQGKIGELSMDKWVNDSFLRKAAQEKGLVYGKDLL